MKRVVIYLVITLGLVLTLSIFSCKGKESSPKEEVKNRQLPNIIYVLADDLGYGDIQAFNSEGKIKTPHLNRLAEEGMRFTDAHTSSAVCTPTRYGILTGRYNWRSPLKNGVLTGTSEALIPNDRETVASLLKRNGYHTAYIGKWHLGWNWAKKDAVKGLGPGWNDTDYENIDFEAPITNSPNDLGFNYAYGHSGSLDMAPYVYVENEKVTAQPNRVTVNKSKYGWWRKGPTGADFEHEQVTPHFFEKSYQYIQEQAKSEQPFFLYLPLPSPHTPVLPTEEWQGKSGMNPYADFMMMIDDYMGQLVQVIKEAGIEKNTLIVFTSDNGCSPQADFEVLAEYGHDPSSIYRGHKADIYEGGHRVPFIVKWPALIKAGSVSDKTICTTDFMATCAAIVEENLLDSAAEDSFSMLPLLKDSNTDGYKREVTIHHSINGSFAIRKGKWKLIFCAGSGGWSYPKPNSKDIDALPEFQLYDLEKDPSETTNLVGSEAKVVNELKSLMVSAIENGRTTPGVNQQNDAPMNGKKWKQIEIFNK
ncbi:Arylsulfatase A [Zhouia amylolytica]|uniref:Arylsulfatase A n=1 Tax=Zhouia amylolytica TaxID=376730 RepID=A0A1I6RUH1_9FLAO|nr:arylsulfatase [Zhouia amylolytica]SFS68375.1 Arylsulfatase A [Zhouia amylolytica]